MRKEDAEELTRQSGEERHFIRETWYCGLINRQIEKAARGGLSEASLRFSAGSWPARHQERFRRLYEAQGYEISFRPNYLQIQPTQYTLTVRWNGEKPEK